MKFYTINPNNIHKIIKNRAINTAQAKILGYPTFSSIPKGWQHKTYELIAKDYELFVALNNIVGKSEQKRIVDNFKMPTLPRNNQILINYETEEELRRIEVVLYQHNIKCTVL